MKLLSNKYFIIGNLLLLLISIPLTLFFIKRQQDVRSKAAPTSKLYFSPESPNTSTQCPSFTMDLMVDPGSNIVSIVDFYIKYDPSELDITDIKEGTAFPTVVRPASITSGAANMSVSVGSDVTKAVQTVSKVATITFKPKVAGPAQVTVDQSQSRVFSLAPADQPTENVLFQTSPSNVNITSDACAGGSGTPVPSGTVNPTPTGTSGGGTIVPSPSAGVSPTTAVSPTASANQAPVCSSFTVSPSSSGSAPLSVLLTANGQDPDTGGLIASTNFNFGDGTSQNVTEGMNLQSVSVQANHTYQNGGTYGASVTFTDNNGLVSQICSQTIDVTGASGSATTAPTAAPTTADNGGAAATTAPEPTVPATGSVAQTVGIIGAVILTVIGGFLLLAL
ncbi:MAG TPA: PKD domain-containing protein [Patescibacteria group bacterium]|nr:PKD domain-containing protein [Patescibacteria group bacterium]